MAEKELVKYIEQQLKKGRAKEAIRKKLKGSDWSDAEINEAFTVEEREEVQVPKKIERTSEKIGFFRKIIYIIAWPAEFFEKVKSENAWNSFFYYTAILLAIMLSYFISLTLISEGIGFFGSIDFLKNLGLLLFYFIILMLIVVLLIAFTHLFIYLFRGKVGIKETFKVTFYSATPALLLGFIPFVNIAALVWSTILQVIGLSKYHELKWWKALLALLIPGVIIGAALFLVVYYRLQQGLGIV